jgi:hypothetical protein
MVHIPDDTLTALFDFCKKKQFMMVTTNRNDHPMNAKCCNEKLQEIQKLNT